MRIAASVNSTVPYGIKLLKGLESPDKIEKFFPLFHDVKHLGGNKYCARPDSLLIRIIKGMVFFRIEDKGNNITVICDNPYARADIALQEQKKETTFIKVDAEVELPSAALPFRNKLQRELEARMTARLNDLKTVQ